MSEGNGTFLVVEGSSGAGKTTIVESVVSQLRRNGRSVFQTREPSDSALGHQIRSAEETYHGLTLALLVTADRNEHVRSAINPHVADGDVVVCDRYVPSSMALQVLDGVPMETVISLNQDFPVPDLTVLVSCSDADRRDRLMCRRSLTRLEVEHLSTESDAYNRAFDLLILARWQTLLLSTSTNSPQACAELVTAAID